MKQPYSAYLSIGLDIIKSRFLNQRKPLFVSWALTNRCNYRCRFCDVYSQSASELDTARVIKLIDELYAYGVKMISFVGGEPTIRDDIGEIIDYAHKRKIFVNVLTNGSLVSSKIKELRNVGLLKMSLNGPEDVHDYLVGKGAYRKSIEAIEIAKSNDIPVELHAILTKNNLEYIDFIVNKAEEFKLAVGFQPVSSLHIFNKDIDYLYMSSTDWHAALEKIIRLKKEGRSITNSNALLSYLHGWPNTNKKINCCAGRIYCYISAQGDIFSCAPLGYRVKGYRCFDGNFKNAFDVLPERSILEKMCFEKKGGPWCGALGTVELSLIYSLEPNVMINYGLRIFKGKNKG